MYLEGGAPEDMLEDEEDDMDLSSLGEGPPQTIVHGAWWNTSFGALLSARGVEVRRELGRDGARLGMLYAGSRMGRYGPRS